MEPYVGEGSETLDGIGGNISIWDAGTLQAKLGGVNQVSIEDGQTFIYNMWKTLLNKWFSYEKAKVYIVTPFLDKKRLEDVCRIILKNNAEEKLAGFFVREYNNQTRQKDVIVNLKQAVKRKPIV